MKATIYKIESLHLRTYNWVLHINGTYRYYDSWLGAVAEFNLITFGRRSWKARINGND